MEKFQKVVEICEPVAIYESAGEVPVRLGRVAVEADTGEVVWEKTVLDHFTFIALPRPFFDRRLANASNRAQAIVNRLNSNQ